MKTNMLFIHHLHDWFGSILDFLWGVLSWKMRKNRKLAVTDQVVIALGWPLQMLWGGTMVSGHCPLVFPSLIPEWAGSLLCLEIHSSFQREPQSPSRHQLYAEDFCRFPVPIRTFPPLYRLALFLILLCPGARRTLAVAVGMSIASFRCTLWPLSA